MTTTTPSFQFQLECFRAANDRLLFRVKRRENWLRMQILLQMALLALFLSLNNYGFDYLFYLPLPLALILTSLYASEDRLVGHIVAYLNSLSANLSLQDGSTALLNLESSPEGRNYVRTTLPLRLLAQLCGFLLLPIGISTFGFSTISKWQSVHQTELVINVLLALVIAWLLYSSYRMRLPK